jgi:anti-sigma28 factor (negative regulator of flagellin synthesis)
MHIDKIGPDALRGGAGREVRDAAGGNPAAPQRVAQAERADRVEISAEGRALAAQETSGGLTAERVALYRGRIQNGTYDQPQVVDQIVRRMIQVGDLRLHASAGEE